MSPKRIRTTRLIILLLFLSALVLSACNLPKRASKATPTAGLATQAAQTVQAGLASPSATGGVQAPTLTSAPASPYPTATQLIFPTISPSPLLQTPTITASADTNCRSGPAKAFPRLGYLLVGQQSTVHGRLGDNSWWYIENPSQPGAYCWVWAESTQVQGDANSLVVLTPPPTPSPQPGAGLAVYFSNLHDCGGWPTLIFQVDNYSEERLRSIDLFIYSVSDDEPLFGPDARNFPFFAGPGGCPPGGDYLNAGQTGYFGADIDWPVPSGDTAVAEIMLCTERDLDGVCAEVKIQFVIP
ncbi:MAG: hypothetical protein JXB15_17750 [Anaerolineales bacterium]|nr:hypothetical protein [Anaerolineales bacterium]